MKRIVIAIKYAALNLLLVVSLSLTSCGGDYLDLSDPSQISKVTSLDDVKLLITSCYGEQHNYYAFGCFWEGYIMYPLDHTIDIRNSGQTNWDNILTGNVTSGTGWVTVPWTYLSKAVYYTNMALDQIDSYRGKARSSEISTLNNYQGEALFFRAFYRWHMLMLYGRPELDGIGIPILNKVPKIQSEMMVGREKTGDCYDAIIADLKEAIPLLAGQTDKSRVDTWAAKAFLAKAYFFKGDNADAKTALEDCIKNSGKSLVSFDVYKDMFNGNEANEHNSESFYEIDNINNPVTGGDYGKINPGTQASMLYSPVAIKGFDPAKGALAGTSYATLSYSNIFMHDRNLTRFGYNDIPPMSAIVKVNGVKQLDPAYVQRQFNMRKNFGTSAYNGPDPRLYVCALQAYIDSVGYKGATVPVSQCKKENWDSSNNRPADQYMWSTRKYQYLKGELSEVNNIAGFNIYFIRLADIYLMYAEVMKDSDPKTALEYVNKVHRRAYGYNPDVTSPFDYKSLTDRTKTLDSSDHLANNPILYERWAELFGEMQWYEHICRLKVGPKEADFYKETNGLSYKTKSTVTWPDKHYAMPIPVAELSTNTNPKMVQTPGY